MVDEPEGRVRGDATEDWRDVNFAENMLRLRTEAGLSQAELVQKLREGRWPSVHQTTISRIEKRERQVRLSEAYLIAGALGSSVAVMTLPPALADAEQRLAKAMKPVAEQYNMIGESVWRLVEARRVLRRAVENARAIVERDEGTPKEDLSLRDMVTQAEAYLTLRVENAVAAGREASLRERDMNYSDFAVVLGASPYDYRPASIDQADIDAPEA